MRRRSTDQHDQISDKEIKYVREPWYRTLKLFITNLPTLAKVIMLIIGVAGGTVAAPEAIRLVDELITTEETPPPIPVGQITTPDPDAPIVAWRGSVNTALSSQANAIDTNTAELEALREEIRNLEARVSKQRARGDNSVSERVTTNENELKILKGIVQP